MNEHEVEKLIQNVGALCELLIIFFNSCRKVGFNESQAIELTKELLRNTLDKSSEKNSSHNEEDE